jgi:hypothetical protein
MTSMVKISARYSSTRRKDERGRAKNVANNARWIQNDSAHIQMKFHCILRHYRQRLVPQIETLRIEAKNIYSKCELSQTDT